ncbi:transposase [Paenibacillus sp. GCM10023252]|uniref:transposase n=1 Tax=Paenibacillus sp. GCM10023252 TaxID=3252649 RepID=UPI00361CA676
MKKKATRKVKTDPIDALRSAQAFYMKEVSPVAQLDPKILGLRALCRQHYQCMSLYGTVQLQFRSVLDLVFPGYDKAFQNVCNTVSLQLLSTFPTPQFLLNASKEDVLRILLGNRRGVTWNQKKLEALLTHARNSLPDSKAAFSHFIAMRNYISLIQAHQAGLADIQKLMLQLASSLPEHALLRSIPGVGPLTASTIQAEIGDIKRFPSVKQLTAFAGLDSSVYESGTFSANQNRISNQLTSVPPYSKLPLQESRSKLTVLSRYNQLNRSQSKLAKVAIVATANKLLRIIFGVWSTHKPFSTSDH